MQHSSEIGSASKDVSNAAASQASDAIRRMGHLAEQGVEQTNAALAIAKERGSEIAADTTEVLSGYRSTIENSVRAQPLLALAIAAFVGVMIDRLWWSR